jgi:hypothetical protein
VIGLPGRVNVVKKLSDALKTVIRLEREAFGIQIKDGRMEPANLNYVVTFVRPVDPIE